MVPAQTNWSRKLRAIHKATRVRMKASRRSWRRCRASPFSSGNIGSIHASATSSAQHGPESGRNATSWGACDGNGTLGVTMMIFLLAALAAAQPADGDGAGRAHVRGGLFLSPMGEPFRSEDPAADNVGAWFARADSDRDGALSLAEMEADAGRFFTALDTNRDGELGPEEVSAYEMEV